MNDKIFDTKKYSKEITGQNYCCFNLNLSKISILVSIILFLLTDNSYAQVAGGVFPLKAGNYWVYDEGYGRYTKYRVLDTNIIIDSVKYFVVEGIYTGSIGLPFYKYLREREDGYFVRWRDTSYHEPNHEQIYYKRGANVGDSWTQLVPSGNMQFKYTAEFKFAFNGYAFNVPVEFKSLHYSDGGLWEYDEIWTEEFGRINSSGFFSVFDRIQGCVIDGVVYGDTSITKVDVESELGLPNEYTLLQNYPNPFNSNTRIIYQVPKRTHVSIKVYNILGGQVAELINKEQDAGRYNIEFDVSALGGLPSGIYLCRLTGSGFNHTIRMVLLK